MYVGTSGYSYKEWKGSFYPKDLAAASMLAYYAERFDTVEINNTFYRMPTHALLEGWAAQVPANFTFALKAPQRITHIQRLKDVGDSVARLFDVATILKERLGPVLFQLPPNFKKDVARLRELFSHLHPKHLVALEFRHQSWFDDETFALLRDHKVALCFAEADDDEKKKALEVPFVSTADWGYVRLRCADYSDADLKIWAKRIAEQQWREAFVFFKHEDEGKGPAMAKQFLKIAKK